MDNYYLKYGQLFRIKETAPRQSEIESLAVMPPNFRTKGMGMLYFDIAPKLVTACSGVVFKEKNASFFTKYSNKKGMDGTYKTSVVLWVTRKLVLTRVDKPDVNQYTVTVEPPIQD